MLIALAAAALQASDPGNGKGSRLQTDVTSCVSRETLKTTRVVAAADDWRLMDVAVKRVKSACEPYRAALVASAVDDEQAQTIQFNYNQLIYNCFRGLLGQVQISVPPERLKPCLTPAR